MPVVGVAGAHIPPPRLPERRRVPAPVLADGFPFLTNSAPHSDAGSPSPGLLTPPVAGPRSMSPPPREEADDYLNLGFRRHGRKHVGNKAKRHHHTREESGLLSSGLRTPASGTRSAGRRESWDASSTASDRDNIADTPTFVKTNQLRLNTNMQDHRVNLKYEPVRVPMWSTFGSSADEVRDVESPATEALRSINQAHSSDTKNGTLRRMSGALAATFGLLVPNNPTPESSDKAGRHSEALHGGSAHGNSLSNPTSGLSRRTTFKSKKEVMGVLGTPATITLRKASNVYAPSPVLSSMNASLLNEHVHKSDPSAPASELLAFYSTPGASTASPTMPSTQLPDESVSPSSVNIEASSFTKVSPRSMRKGSVSMAVFKDDRRCSHPAETTLTFADVHVASGSFATEVRSGKEPWMPVECNRRISVVHFRSRNSVHEVIWREDETTSDSSLPSNSTSPPRQADCSHPGTIGLESDDKLVQQPEITDSSHNYDSPILPVSAPKVDRPQEVLSEWSWAKQTSSAGLMD